MDCNCFVQDLIHLIGGKVSAEANDINQINCPQ